MGKLERARIHVLKGDGTQGRQRRRVYIDVCFNPKEYSLEKSVEWDAEKAFTDAPQPEFKAPKPMTLSVTLQFDTYEERTNVRDKWVRQIEKLTMMTKQFDEGRQERLEDGQAEVSSADDPVHLGPLHRSRASSSRCRRSTRCSCPTARRCAPSARSRSATCSTTTIDDDNEPDVHQAAAATASHTRSRPDDRLDLIAAKELGDAGRWTEIAAMNDIVDPAASPTATASASNS